MKWQERFVSGENKKEIHLKTGALEVQKVNAQRGRAVCEGGWQSDAPTARCRAPLRGAGVTAETHPAHKKLLNCFGYKFYSGTLWLPCSSLALLLPGAASLPQGGITPHLLTLQIHVFNLHSPGHSSYIFDIHWNHVPLQLGSAWKTSPAPAQRCTPLGIRSLVQTGRHRDGRR